MGVDSTSHILAIVILDVDGERLAARYNSSSLEVFPDIQSQCAFEKRIIQKLPKPSAQRSDTRWDNADVAIIDDFLVLFKGTNDVFVCVVANTHENEIMLTQLLDGIFGSLTATTCTSIISQGLSKRSILEGLEMTILILDEVQDDGVILETEEEKIIARVKMHAGGTEALSTPGRDAFAQATENTKNKLLHSLFGSG
eukprot:GEMP01062673.1.p1 GENE.GEMP01062673.1~~GEMP01062673.1.p1  ORF type:complete len:198 (+),score=45.16 GEMP01062673.1:104-697(+)